VAKSKNTKRTRAKARSGDVERTIATTLNPHQLQLRRQRWRALKEQFDHVSGLCRVPSRQAFCAMAGSLTPRNSFFSRTSGPWRPEWRRRDVLWP